MTGDQEVPVADNRDCLTIKLDGLQRRQFAYGPCAVFQTRSKGIHRGSGKSCRVALIHGSRAFFGLCGSRIVYRSSS